MWKFKTMSNGNITAAVQRRVELIDRNNTVDLDSHESRSKFGYNYLEYVK
jgi:hypothetical protein